MSLLSPGCGTNTVSHLFSLLGFQKCPSYLKRTKYLAATHAGFMSHKIKWKHRVTFLGAAKWQSFILWADHTKPIFTTVTPL